jgi:HK97 family phage portal protein
MVAQRTQLSDYRACTRYAYGVWPFRRKAPAAAPKAATISISDPRLIEYFGGLPGWANAEPVTEFTATALSAVYRAVEIVAGTVAGLPLRSLTERNGQKQKATSFLDAPGGPDGLTQFEWVDLLLWHLQLHGNGYGQHIFNGAGGLIGMNLVHPLAVAVEWDASRPGGKKFTATLDDGTTKDFDATTMTQFMGPSLDGLKGMSVLTLARLSLGTAISGDKAANRMFTNGAMISGLVTPDDDIESGGGFEEGEADVIRESINSKMTGTENAGQIAVINRRLKFTPWSLSAEDAQFIESREFSISEVARWFGVPANLLMKDGAVSTWGQGIEVVNRGLHRYTLSGWTSRIEQRLTRLMAGKRFAEFDYAGYLKPSPEQEIDLLIKQVDAGLLTLNEARAIRNLPPVEGGDTPRGVGQSPAPEPPEADEEEAAA